MSFKPIDIQVSLPRAAEMAPLAHQQQHKAVAEQAALGQQAVKTAEQEAQRSHKTESAAGGTINERDPRERNKRYAGKRKPSEQDSEAGAQAPAHPYKGKHIDFTL